jgi:hypothetical protein
MTRIRARLGFLQEIVIHGQATSRTLPPWRRTASHHLTTAAGYLLDIWKRSPNDRYGPDRHDFADGLHDVGLGAGKISAPETLRVTVAVEETTGTARIKDEQNIAA